MASGGLLGYVFAHENQNLAHPGSFPSWCIAVGCDKQPAASQQMDKVQNDLKQTASDLKDYTYTQKDEFVKTMQTQMTNLDSDLDKLSATVDSSSDAVKADAKPKLSGPARSGRETEPAACRCQRAPPHPPGTASKPIPKKAYAPR